MRLQSAIVWIGALGLAGATDAFAGPLQSEIGRIDVVAKEKSFDLGEVCGSPGSQVEYCRWFGRGKEKTGAICEKRLGPQWEELWIEFVPRADGEVEISLRGEQTRGRTTRLVWVDGVKVDGGRIVNGEFEQAGPDGKPIGWDLTGEFPPGRYSRDKSVAAGGKGCIAVCSGSQARQVLAVEKGKRYRVYAWFRLIHPHLFHEIKYVRMEKPMETYSQRLRIEFKSAEAGRKASVSVKPLYDDYTWAISSRWDDNNESDLKMRDTLAAHCHKGTFYLNSSRYWSDFTKVARQLLKGGNSIGGHSLTHPMLTQCSRNRIFEELAGIRAEWEALADTQVLSYTFSFCRYHNPMEGGIAVHADINRALERAGYYHVANHRYDDDLKTDVIVSPIMPGDGAEIDAFAEAALRDKAFRDKHPNLSYSMHVWYETPEAWKKFEDQLDKYGRNPNWWYCNQNEYAAYRYQFLHGGLGKVEREDGRISVSIERPVLLELNDPTPLTLEIEGVSPDEVASVKCETGDTAISERQGGRYLFHLYHDRDQRLPVKIGRVHNADNRPDLTDADKDLDFPDIKALLHFHDGKLQLAIDNQGTEPLTNLCLTYRLPLAWEQGVLTRKIDNVPARSRREDSIAPKQAEGGYKYNSGLSYFVVQVDFVRGGKAGRIHASCHVRNDKIDRSYPQGGFARLGPIPVGKFEIDKLRSDIERGRLTTRPWSLSGGAQFEWTVDDSPFEQPFLDPETVRTYGSFRCKEAIHFVLQSDVRSERDLEVDLIHSEDAVPHLFVNGTEVADGRARFHKGLNRLVLVFKSQFGTRRFSMFSPEHAGCFLRVAKPDTFDRITDIRFEPPRSQKNAKAN